LTGLTVMQSGGMAVISGATITAGAIVETLVSGIALVRGSVQNSGGTLLASGTAGFVEITSGAVVRGGFVEVGDGIIDVLSGGTANVFFTPTGSGELRIADTASSPSVFTGTISGFGGLNHSNQNEFIDLINVTSAPSAITFSYTSSGGSNASGTLLVSSGGVEVAKINFVGSYTSANFNIGSGVISSVTITDPGVVNGGSVDGGAVPTFDAHSGIDLPDIAFGAQTTLAYAVNAAGTGGTLTVSDGRHAASIALLGAYMAGSFVTTADGHGGALVTEAQPHEQTLLAHPRA
jgi:hypothetical protein